MSNEMLNQKQNHPKNHPKKQPKNQPSQKSRRSNDIGEQPQSFFMLETDML